MANGGGYWPGWSTTTTDFITIYTGGTGGSANETVSVTPSPLPFVAPKKEPETETEWLRRRVAEVLWQAA